MIRLGSLVIAGAAFLGVQPPASRAVNCDAVATFADGKHATTVVHVATSGNDATGNGSAARPFRSIQRAAGNIQPGTAVRVHSGVYEGGIFLRDLRGSADRPIWVGGAAGERRPVIRGGAEGIHLSRPRFVVLEDLEVASTGDNGINVDDGGEVANEDAARFVVIRRVDVREAGRQPSGIADCLKMAGVNDFVIAHSSFGRCGSGEGSGAVGVGGVGVHRGTILFNRFASNGFGGVQVKGGSTDIEIRGNLFYETGWRAVNMGGSTGDQFFRPPLSAARGLVAEAARVRAVANIFNRGEAAAAFVGCTDCQFTHNTVIDAGKWLLRILQERPEAQFARASRGVIADNIFYFRRAEVNAGEDINIGPQTDSGTFLLRRNLWYAHDAPRQSAPRLPGFRGREAESVAGTDPAFVDPATGDFHLMATSPAKAAASGAYTPASDFEGRCYANPPSLGALEIAPRD